MVKNAYGAFRHSAIAPTKQLNHDTWLLNYHGPTLAFKDFALQLLGDYSIISWLSVSVAPMGATSGDTDLLPLRVLDIQSTLMWLSIHTSASVKFSGDR